MIPKHRARRRGWRTGLLGTAAAITAPLAGGVCGPAAAAGVVLPSGGHVQAGSAVIGAPAGGALTVSQSSGKAVIDWASFSIGAAGAVRFDNGSGATLNRVTGGSQSRIDGRLSATGSVFLLNPDGVIIGRDGVVSVGGGFVASTLDLTNDQFMTGGPLIFSGSSAASVLNAGDIVAAGGNVALIGASVENDGRISAADGTVGLAAGHRVALRDQAADDGKLAVLLGGPDTSATNTGLIAAASAELRANGGNVYALAVNTGGRIEATGVSTTDGKVFLVAEGGTVTARGRIDAARADGSGGLVETSGWTVDFTGLKVKAANWLIDPVNLTVDAAAATTIDANLATTSVTLQTTAATASGPGVQSAGAGDIVVAAPIAWSSANTLTLDAYHSIAIDAGVTASGAGKVALKTNDGGSGGSLAFGPGASLDFTGAAGGGQALSINGQAYALVQSQTDLSNINNNLAGFYALAKPMDLGGTAFTTAPIASSASGSGFTGVLEGLGNTISNLKISDTTSVPQTIDGSPSNGLVGLFGFVGASGRAADLTLANAQVTGGDGMFVGALAGVLGGTVTNAASSGAVITGGADTAGGTTPAIAGGLIGVGTGSVVNSHSSATVTAGNEGFAGGLAGVGIDGATIIASFATGAVTTGGYLGGQHVPDAGGLVGALSGNPLGGGSTMPVTVTGSYATGRVTGGGGSNVGGFAGELQAGQIDTSYATGSTTQTAGGIPGPNGQQDSAGGFIGRIGTGGVVTQSWSSAAVNTIGGANNTNYTFAGGFVGGMDSGAVVSHAYALGSVTSKGSFSFIGGFGGTVQSSSSVTDVYATGLVTGSGFVGGLVGQVGNGGIADMSGAISNSYWDEGTTGQTTGYNLQGTGTATKVIGIGGSTGLGPYTGATYGNFDLANTWFLIDGSTRPILRSEYSTTITDAHQLQLMTLKLGAAYTLAGDIDASETIQASGVWNPATGFVPVGGNGNPGGAFGGVLDGQGHTVSNLTIIETTQVLQTVAGFGTDGAVGLFGVIGASGVVENINLSNAKVTGGDGFWVGALAGANTGSVINAASSGVVTGGNGVNTGSGSSEIAGGLVGGSTGSIQSSQSSATVSAGDDAFSGGLAGAAAAGATITGSFATGSVRTGGHSATAASKQYSLAGGLVGYLYGYHQGGVLPVATTITGSYATGAVSGGGGSFVGGLAGDVTQGQIGTSWATGSVTQTAGGQNGHADVSGGFAGVIDAGGVVTLSWSGGAVTTVGGSDASNLTLAGGFVGGMRLGARVSNSYALGAVSSTGSSFSDLGGFAGLIQQSASIDHVYTTGLVSGPGALGGLAGQVGNGALADPSGSISASYWDEGTTGQTVGYTLSGTGAATNVLGVGGTTLINPYLAATYARFDLGAVWFMVDASTRPILRGEYSTTIVNAHQLQLMDLNLAASYTLAADIDAGETRLASGVWNAANGFVPVGGNGAAAFTGVLDGQGHTISNLAINDTAPVPQTIAGYSLDGAVGLIGFVGIGGVLQNINLANARVTGGDGMSVGALAGVLDGSVLNAASSGVVTGGGGVNTGTGFASASVGGLVGSSSGAVVNSLSAATVAGADAFVGGLVGATVAGASIAGSYATGDVTTGGKTGTQVPEAGGLVGIVYGYQFGGVSPIAVTINTSHATGAVNGGGGSVLGGLVGAVDQAAISTSYATGSVTQTAGGQNGQQDVAGGFAGYLGAGAAITQSWSRGAVDTVGSSGAAVPGAPPGSIYVTFAGGFVGDMDAVATTSASYALGPVNSTGTSFNDLGGFAGVILGAASADHVYATGLVTGSGALGGLAGLVGCSCATVTSGFLSASYWDEGTTGRTIGYNLSGTGMATNVTGIGGATGLSPYAAASYANFDLANTWFLIAGSTRPILRSDYSTNIFNAHQLQLMSLNLGASYTIATDIDASETSQASGVWNPANGFVPVGGNGAAAFTGLLDGQGATVSKLTIIDTTPVHQTIDGAATNGLVGLFGLVGTGGAIENISLANAHVTGGDGMIVGALAGALSGSVAGASSSGAVTTGNGDAGGGSTPSIAGGLVGASLGSLVNSNSSAMVSGGNDTFSGGLVGAAVSGASIAGSFATGAVVVGSYSGGQNSAEAGGLVGAVNGNPTGAGPMPVTITSSYATGSVSGAGGSDVGGFAAVVQTAQISTSYATGSVTQTAGGSGAQDRAGGFAAYMGGGGVVTQSYASGSVNTVGAPAGSGFNTLAGGFVGLMELAASVSESYALGPVTATAGQINIGGFAGQIRESASANHAYATGLVTGSGVAGGLVGEVGNGAYTDTTGYLSNSYWDEGTTGQTTGYHLQGTGTATNITGIGGATGFSPYASASYANLDLANSWFLVEGQTRPILRGEYSTSITDAHQLQLMSLNPDASYTIAGDIDASETTSASGVWNPANGFVPVGGNGAAPFTGTLDGQGHTVSNLTIIHVPAVFSTSDRSVGLFGLVSGAGALLENVNLANAHVTGSDGTRVGALVGYLQGGVILGVSSSGLVTTGNTISNINGVFPADVGGVVGLLSGPISDSSSSATVTGGDARAGGLVGAGAEITGSFATGDVSVGAVTPTTAGAFAGGLIGLDQSIPNPGFVTDSYATGNVSGGGGSVIGGLAGQVYQITFINSYATGAVTQTAGGQNGLPSIAGGFAGILTSSAATQSFASGAVNTVGGPSASLASQAGGFVGQLSGSSVSDAYARGQVTSTGGAFNDLGGLAGLIEFGGNASHVYATGLVTGSGAVGGLAGQVGNAAQSDPSGSVSNSYWDEGTTGRTAGYNLSGTGTAANVVGISGATGISPFAQATYAGWDFSNIWSPPSAGFYPELYGVSHVLRIRVDDTYAIYGGMPTFTASFHGLQPGDGPQVVSGLSIAPVGGTTSASGLTNAGLYTLAASGASASDSSGGYRLIYASRLADISPRPLTASLAGAVRKTYDGATAATLAAANYRLAGAIVGDSVALNDPTSGAYATRNAGTGKTVSVGGLALTGSDAGDYIVNAGASAPIGIIDPKALLALLAGTVEKTYDGAAAASLAAGNYQLSGVVGGDNVALNDPTSGTYDTKNAGTGKTVSVASLALTGTDAGNYTVNAAASAAIGVIDAKALLASLAGPVEKTYDGTTAATLASSNYQLAGVVGGDSVVLNDPAAGSYDTKDAGTGKTVSVAALGLTGADAGNYTVNAAASAPVGIIDPKALVASLTGSVEKAYDGTTAATLAASNYQLAGVVGGDSVALDDPTNGVYDTRNAGSGKTISVATLALSGADAHDYTVNGAAAAPIGIVDPKALVASLTGTVRKTYDGTTVANLATSNYQLAGAISGDNVALNDPASGTYGTKNVGTGETVGVAALRLTGSDAGNYTVNAAASSPIGIIDPKALAAALIGPIEKTYDGTTAATLAAGNYQLAGVVSGDSVALNDPVGGTYDNRDAGAGKTVSVAALAISGADAGNYTVNAAASDPVGIIDPKSLVASLTGPVQKTYDGTTAASLTASNYVLSSGVLAGDSVALNDPAAGTYDSKNVGSGRSVTVATLGLTGADAGNYKVNATASAAIGIIDPKALIASLIGPVEKIYDGTTAATLTPANYQLAGPVSGDAVALNNPTSGAYDTKDPGTGKTVSVAGLGLTGADAGNYTVNPGAAAPVGVIDAASPTPIQTAIVTSPPVAEVTSSDTVDVVAAVAAAGVDSTAAGASPVGARPTSMVGIFPVIGSPPTDFIGGNSSPVTGAGNGDLWAGSDLDEPCPDRKKECKR